MRIVALLAMLLMATASAGVDPDPLGYERVLLPTHFTGKPGAFGSLWVTEFVGRNEGGTVVQIFNTECAFFCECIGITCTRSGGTPPGFPFFATSPRSDDNWANPGYFLYVGRSGAASVAMQLRVRDIWRSSTSFGTEVPVVRERDARTSTIYLLDIPLDARFRQHLRVYGIGNVSDVFDVRVRILADYSNTVLADVPLRLRPGRVAGMQQPKDEFPMHPAYAEIPALRDLVTDPAVERIRIEVIPQFSRGAFWAFVAVTNNETQHVTLVTPQ